MIEITKQNVFALAKKVLKSQQGWNSQDSRLILIGSIAASQMFTQYQEDPNLINEINRMIGYMEVSTLQKDTIISYTQMKQQNLNILISGKVHLFSVKKQQELQQEQQIINYINEMGNQQNDDMQFLMDEKRMQLQELREINKYEYLKKLRYDPKANPIFKSDICTLNYVGDSSPGFCFGAITDAFLSSDSDYSQLNRTHLITAATDVTFITFDYESIKERLEKYANIYYQLAIKLFTIFPQIRKETLAPLVYRFQGETHNFSSVIYQEQDSKSDCFYVLFSGTVEIQKYTSGRENRISQSDFTVRRVGIGETFGLEDLYRGKNRGFSAIGMSETPVIVYQLYHSYIDDIQDPILFKEIRLKCFELRKLFDLIIKQYEEINRKKKEKITEKIIALEDCLESPRKNTNELEEILNIRHCGETEKNSDIKKLNVKLFFSRQNCFLIRPGGGNLSSNKKLNDPITASVQNITARDTVGGGGGHHSSSFFTKAGSSNDQMSHNPHRVTTQNFVTPREKMQILSNHNLSSEQIEDLKVNAIKKKSSPVRSSQGEINPNPVFRKLKQLQEDYIISEINQIEKSPFTRIKRGKINMTQYDLEFVNQVKYNHALTIDNLTTSSTKNIIVSPNSNVQENQALLLSQAKSDEVRSSAASISNNRFYSSNKQINFQSPLAQQNSSKNQLFLRNYSSDLQLTSPPNQKFINQETKTINNDNVPLNKNLSNTQTNYRKNKNNLVSAFNSYGTAVGDVPVKNNSLQSTQFNSQTGSKSIDIQNFNSLTDSKGPINFNEAIFMANKSLKINDANQSDWVNQLFNQFK